MNATQIEIAQVISYTPRTPGVFSRHPVVTAVCLTAANVAVGLLAGIAAKAFMPQLDPAFVALCVETVLIAALLTGLGWWRVAGFNRPVEWCHLGLLWLPAVVSGVLPLLIGVKALEPSMALFLAVAYVITGIYEEAWSRGLILGLLRPSGAIRAIILSAALFAALHATNFVFRSPRIVLAQMVGAFCFGVAYGALRVRTNTIWFLILLHAVHDLLLRYTNFPVIPLDVVRDAILLIYGLYLMRDLPQTRSRAEAPGDSARPAI